MARWIDWRKIADNEFWYKDSFDWEEAAVYELAVRGPRGGNHQTKYVGETKNEKQRIRTYARSGSHLYELINDELKNGKTLWYRSLRMKSKEDAVSKQNKLLSEFSYPWNTQLNSW